MTQEHKIRASLGYLVLFGVSLCIVSASESPFGAPRSSTTTTTTTTTTSTTTPVPVESSTAKPISSGNNETLPHTHDNLNGTEGNHLQDHGGNLTHLHNSLPGFDNSSLESDKLSSHSHSDAPSLTLFSSTILIICLTLGTFVILF